MYHFAKKISRIHLCLYMIFVESVFGGSRDYSVDTPRTHTHPTILKSNGFIGCVQLNAISKS